MAQQIYPNIEHFQFVRTDWPNPKKITLLIIAVQSEESIFLNHFMMEILEK